MYIRTARLKVLWEVLWSDLSTISYVLTRTCLLTQPREPWHFARAARQRAWSVPQCRRGEHPLVVLPQNFFVCICHYQLTQRRAQVQCSAFVGVSRLHMAATRSAAAWRCATWASTKRGAGKILLAAFAIRRQRIALCRRRILLLSPGACRKVKATTRLARRRRLDLGSLWVPSLVRASAAKMSPTRCTMRRYGSCTGPS